MAMGVYTGGHGQCLRVGPERHGYVYYGRGDMWKGVRGMDGAAANQVLFMHKDVDGYWYAVNASKDKKSVADVKMDGVGVFRTREDALSSGWHFWETNWNASSGGWPDWRNNGLCCETTWL